MKYREAGVDIDRAAAFVDRIKGAAESTRRPGWLDGLGGFGACFKLDLTRYRNPILVSGTDGVGTKLRVAQAMNRHDTIGIDLVAMCVNDVLVQGAEPLFFLDYLGVGSLDPGVAVEIVEGIAEGCRQAGCSLVGGETAELPGMYPPGDYDLAGFTVGVVEEERLVNGRSISPGDLVLGLPSSGVHSNGYSLVRAIAGEPLAEVLGRPAPWGGGGTLGDALLAPTVIYVPHVLPLLETGAVRGMAHITGGGLTENLARVLPPGTGAVLDTTSWDVPPLFRWLAETGNVPEDEMRRVFNMGLGFLLIVRPDGREAVERSLASSGMSCRVVGRIESGDGRVGYV